MKLKTTSKKVQKVAILNSWYEIPLIYAMALKENYMISLKTYQKYKIKKVKKINSFIYFE